MFTPIPLQLPSCSPTLKEKDGKVYVFDGLRKKYLLLTPEEWVRQHWISYLAQHKGYPKSLMHAEAGLKLNDLQKRSDLIVYNPEGEKILLAEFKAPHVKITQVVFDQIARYNIVYRIPLLIVSNGLKHYYCKIDFDKGDYVFLQDLPAYSL